VQGIWWKRTQDTSSFVDVFICIKRLAIKLSKISYESSFNFASWGPQCQDLTEISFYPAGKNPGFGQLLPGKTLTPLESPGRCWCTISQRGLLKGFFGKTIFQPGFPIGCPENRRHFETSNLFGSPVNYPQGFLGLS